MDWQDWWPNKTEWVDCTVGFYCECGNKETIVLDEGSNPTICLQCGRVYRLCVHVEIAQATEGQIAKAKEDYEAYRKRWGFVAFRETTWYIDE